MDAVETCGDCVADHIALVERAGVGGFGCGVLCFVQVLSELGESVDGWAIETDADRMQFQYHLLRGFLFWVGVIGRLLGSVLG